MVEIVIGGVQKSGTTALHAYLVRHPQIVGGYKKELHFFDDVSIDWNLPDYNAYHTKFPERSEGQMLVDASPSYIYLPHCLERLKRYNPHVRLIFIFRDPIERAWSHWSQRTRLGFETLDFDAAVHAEKDRLASYPPGDIAYKEYAYIDRGRYGRQLERVFGIFERQQVLCLASDSLKKNREGTLARVADHLGIEAFISAPAIEANKGPGKPIQMKTETRRFICEALRNEIAHFTKLSGLNTEHWDIFND
jgi:hypothetical protein